MSWASQSEERSLGSHQRKMTTGGGAPAVRGGAPGKQIMTEERRQNNYWETHRQEKQKESDLVSGLLHPVAQDILVQHQLDIAAGYQ